MFLDIIEFYETSGTPLPYDPWKDDPIPVATLKACAEKQGVTFRQGDILLLRMGFIQKYYLSNQEGRDALGSKPETLYVFRYCFPFGH